MESHIGMPTNYRISTLLYTFDVEVSLAWSRYQRLLSRAEQQDMWEIKNITPRHYAYHAHQLMQTLAREREIVAEHFLVMTDETDPEWL